MVCSNKIWNRLMLNDEGNAGERWKQQWIQLAKKQLCTCSTLFLFISLPLFCTTTTWNFQKLLSYTFYGGNVVRVLVHFFSLPLIFTLHWWLLAFLIFSPPLQNFHVVLPTKKCLLCFFISCSTYLSPFYSMNIAGSMGSTITTLFSSTSCMHQ